MFGWIGWRKGMGLWLSYKLNAGLRTDVEEIFEGIAETRRDLLMDWSHECWSHMDRLKEKLLEARGCSETSGFGVQPQLIRPILEHAYGRAADFTELFVLSAEGEVIASTSLSHERALYNQDSILNPALAWCRKDAGKRLLYGPYADPVTRTLGPRSSPFHDEMTLLFIEPLTDGGVWQGAVCGRVPNDVIGDLIQRESGHVYPDSGDNYIFMAQPGLDRQIKPGTALSRSRFEDRTFTHGENLKDGVSTDWGTVSVKEHTELELVFTDPATGELHPGVANTIRNGSNLFIQFPGYSDYRHIPVIGKGVTFQLPHCPDRWGMMCEGDLEEVYRIRRLSWQLLRMQMVAFLLLSVLSGLLVYAVAAGASAFVTALAAVCFNLLFGAAAIYAIQVRYARPAGERLNSLQRFIRINAEGKGDLTKRLDTSVFSNDETREIAKWINNMIDSLEGIMKKVKLASEEVLTSQRQLGTTTAETAESTERVGATVHEMISSIRQQLEDIDVARSVSDQMRSTLRELEQQAAGQIAVAQGEVERIGEKMVHITGKVEQTNGTIREFMETADEIRNVMQVIEEISAQTHLLALNASIEAARVGEHGRGFAVVASEIRKLADLTKESTDQVQDIVAQIENNAARASESMNEGSRAVEEGGKLVQAAAETLHAAKLEDSAKTQLVDEVVELMGKIAAVSMQNRAASREVEDRVEELVGSITQVRYTSAHVEGITRFLQQLVGQFQLTEDRRG
ncbi:methyl-accepting chemotaxis protein [Paenibacillus sambharensis]|uniref:Methyl-accepting chemotaxis protein n=1 Tax=Paenibacillus sambharensis TaxID=1803190 RepID=A0A2W1LIE6_9BACL|nr:methyl-accepting chemotaxis protein [Paenibacillus sambharensis]PZD97790.1 methyl-accepting chemotaxis protein [Paenibacillus sambharensis]